MTKTAMRAQNSTQTESSTQDQQKQQQPEHLVQQYNHPSSAEVEALSKALSIKTLAADCWVDLRRDAIRILEASKEDTFVQGALEALRSVRNGLVVGSTLTNPDDDTGVQDYCAALGTLAGHLASGAPRCAESALLCCQMFISYEQGRGDFTAMAQHLLAGLRVMHDLGARPGFAGGAFMPARCGHLPQIDVFILTMKAAPCKFSDPPAPRHASSYRPIEPNTRVRLVETAHATIALLDRASKVTYAQEAATLLPEKAALLHTLASLPAYVVPYEPIGGRGPIPSEEQMASAFLKQFHIILKIVLLSVLDSRPDFLSRVKDETNALADTAVSLTEGVRKWKRIRTVQRKPSAGS